MSNRRHAMIRAARRGSLFGRIDGHGPPRPFSAVNTAWLADDLEATDPQLVADIKLVYLDAYDKAHGRARAQMA